MSVQNFSFLARLEVAEKFVVLGWWWSRPSLGFSFSQAEQKDGRLLPFSLIDGSIGYASKNTLSECCMWSLASQTKLFKPNLAFVDSNVSNLEKLKMSLNLLSTYVLNG